MVLIVSKAIKEHINENNMRMSKEVIDAVEVHMRTLLAKAIARAVDNGRSTVMAQDV